MKIAATNFSLQPVASENEFWNRFQSLCSKAQKDGAAAIVFPEYFSLSLMMAQSPNGKFREVIHSSRAHSEGVVERAAKIATQLSLPICLGTLPWPDDGALKNRSWMLRPGQAPLFQDKIFMTRFENEEWGVKGGIREVKTFELGGFKTAILTCYDSEFATLSMDVGKAGVELLLVPSCTDTHHGYWRVRHCCEARAVENQMFVVMASIVGGDKSFSEIDGHHGQAGVFTPCDTGFTPDGVAGLASENDESLVIVDLSRDQLNHVRKDGAVLNLRDQR